MQNHPILPRPGPHGISCEGYTYTRSPNTRAVGSAVNWLVINGFWARAAGSSRNSSTATSQGFRFCIIGWEQLYLFRRGTSLPGPSPKSNCRRGVRCPVEKLFGQLIGDAEI